MKNIQRVGLRVDRDKNFRTICSCGHEIKGFFLYFRNKIYCSECKRTLWIVDRPLAICEQLPFIPEEKILKKKRIEKRIKALS